MRKKKLIETREKILFFPRKHRSAGEKKKKKRKNRENQASIPRFEVKTRRLSHTCPTNRREPDAFLASLCCYTANNNVKAKRPGYQIPGGTNYIALNDRALFGERREPRAIIKSLSRDRPRAAHPTIRQWFLNSLLRIHNRFSCIR